MKKYTVNIESKVITPYVVFADNEFEAMIKAVEGSGEIHESGSIEIGTDPSNWKVESYTNFPFNKSKMELI